MRSFTYQRAPDVSAAVATFAANAQYLAGGTTLLDLMKLDVMRPERVIDIGALADRHSGIEAKSDGLYLGALAHMADTADHPTVRRDYPLIAQSLNLAASPQLRNMATLGGNVLQRTRCNYFRDPSWVACNKRNPGSGCAALEGVNRKHAVLGVTDACIATYPGDFAQALIALDANVQTIGPQGARTFPFETLHRAPGDRPDLETNLRPGEIIVGFFVPAGAWTRRSLYLKIRDRQSYEFALASAAVALDVEGGVIRQARVALGGVATKPWRAREAEAALAGKTGDQALFERAAAAAFGGARAREGNRYKIELGRRTLVRALRDAAAMQV